MPPPGVKEPWTQGRRGEGAVWLLAHTALRSAAGVTRVQG